VTEPTSHPSTASSTDRLRVLVVEDHPIFRDGLRTGLAPLTDMVIVAEVATVAEAITATRQLRPHVVLRDLRLPDRHGTDAIRQITTEQPETAVLVLTMHDDDASLFAAIRAGARGYLLKGADQAELARAIRGVAAGEAVFGPGVARRVLSHLPPGPLPGTAGSPDNYLTQRERQIVDLLAQGWGNHTIARRLGLAPKTVRNHVSNVITKLHAADRGEAIVRARAIGYGNPDTTLSPQTQQDMT
jgi:DNA-binding NarL/FixJ family response regulator